MIDSDGFRANVGIILSDARGRVFWARRVNQSGWQFPQGGIGKEESAEDAMFRELREEVGLERQHVEVLGHTRRWLRYRLPPQYLRHGSLPLCIGQKQRWYLLRFTGSEQDFRFDAGDIPEFDDWQWVDYWTPADEVIFFKRKVYRRALRELAPFLFDSDDPRATPAFNSR
ncbi:MAG: RNA pyrophosphohydrolase [Proteobacteria bacterium]|nr:RNA pyrophosphohydrolase [Pseudomonadota bacterium]